MPSQPGFFNQRNALKLQTAPMVNSWHLKTVLVVTFMDLRQRYLKSFLSVGLGFGIFLFITEHVDKWTSFGRCDATWSPGRTSSDDSYDGIFGWAWRRYSTQPLRRWPSSRRNWRASGLGFSRTAPVSTTGGLHAEPGATTPLESSSAPATSAGSSPAACSW